MLLSHGRTRTQGCHCDRERKPRASVPVHGAPPVVGATETTSYALTPLNARTFDLTLVSFIAKYPRASGNMPLFCNCKRPVFKAGMLDVGGAGTTLPACQIRSPSTPHRM